MSGFTHKEDFANEYDILEEEDLQEPPMYAVYLLNDDYTTMDFVVMILMKIFHKDRETAERIMLDVHKKGKGRCGIYVREIAETKIKQVSALAKEHNFPLRCTMEEI